MSIEVSNEVRVKDEPICDSQSISQTKIVKKVKEEPIEEVEVKAEEKFSATEEFVNKISIAFLNEETTQQVTTSTDDNYTIETNIQRNKSQKSK